MSRHLFQPESTSGRGLVCCSTAYGLSTKSRFHAWEDDQWRHDVETLDFVKKAFDPVLQPTAPSQ